MPLSFRTSTRASSSSFFLSHQNEQLSTDEATHRQNTIEQQPHEAYDSDWSSEPPDIETTARSIDSDGRYLSRGYSLSSAAAASEKDLSYAYDDSDPSELDVSPNLLRLHQSTLTSGTGEWVDSSQLRRRYDPEITLGPKATGNDFSLDKPDDFLKHRKRRLNDRQYIPRTLNGRIPFYPNEDIEKGSPVGTAPRLTTIPNRALLKIGLAFTRFVALWKFLGLICLNTNVKLVDIMFPAPAGVKRVWWTCKCGIELYDDYLDDEPERASKSTSWYKHQWPPTEDSDFTSDDGASEETVSFKLSKAYARATSLVGRNEHLLRTVDGESRSLASDQPTLPAQVHPNLSSRYSGRQATDSWKSTTRGRPGLWGREWTLPLYRQKSESSDVTSIGGGRRCTPVAPEWLMLCVPCHKYANKVLRLETSVSPETDQQFFRLLKDQYTRLRGGLRRVLRLRAMIAIRFVRFEAFHNDLADVREYDCLPPKSQKHCYKFQPLAPGQKPPPIGQNQMMHLYAHPEDASDWRDLFPRVPRKVKGPLPASAALTRSRHEGYANQGWGLCFVEGISWWRFCLFGFAVVLTSMVFGIVWTVVQDDIQGGFGVASYMLGVQVLALGALQMVYEM